jgi:hypothetical protein
VKYLGVLFGVLMCSVGGGWWAGHALSPVVEMFGREFDQGLVAVLVFISGHLLFEACVRPGTTMSRLWPFRQIRRFRKWLWGTVSVSILLAIGVGIYTTRLQRNLDRDERGIQEQPSAAPEPDVNPDDR